MAIDIIARGMIESSKNDISQLFDITKGGEIVNNESSYSIDNAADYPLLGLNLYGKSTQDGTPTPENPVDIVSVGDSGAVEITACGKNLINCEPINFVGGQYIFLNTHIPLPAGVYTIHFDIDNITNKIANISTQFIVHNTKGTSIFNTTQKLGVYCNDNYFTFNLDTDGASIQLYVNNVNLYQFTVNNISIMHGDTGTLYEPYKANTATISTALPLCGVGDVCDEIIYNADGTGKIVKRIGKYTFTGNEGFALRGNRDDVYTYSVTNLLQFKRGAHANVLCDKYNSIGNVSNIQAAIATLQSGEVCVWNQTDNCTIYFGSNCSDLESFKAEVTGATVMYQLAESQEIELSAAEISALREMRTYSGITNISNDGGADMDVKYCTNKALSEFVYPITTGLQKQIDELKVAVLSLGGNV